MTYTAKQRAEHAERIHAYEKSGPWKARADQYRADHGNYCDACGGTGGLLHVDVHHRSYDGPGMWVGDEADRDLRALCRPHHEAVHDLARSPGWGLADATDYVIRHGGRGRPSVRRKGYRSRRRRFALWLAPLLVVLMWAALLLWIVSAVWR